MFVFLLLKLSKSMKKLRQVLLVTCFLLSLTACKKDVPPTLLVTVVDDFNTRLPNVWVEISVDGANDGILNPQVIDSSFTDEFGTARFPFDNTVLVDIAIYENRNTDVKEDSTSVLLETARSIDDDNLIEKKLVVRSLP